MLAGREPRQHDLPSVAVARVDLDRAIEDDVHGVARIALVKQHGARREDGFSRGGGQRVEAVDVETAEETAAAQRFSEVDHGGA